jgi:putative membrane protein
MKYSTKHITCIAGSFIIAGLMAANGADTTGTTDNAKLSSKGASFVKEASAGNQSEIALAQLAQSKSQSPEVKDLAQMIQKDHQQAQEKLQTIAQAHSVTLDTTPTWTQKREQSKLEKLNGAEFDQQYTKDMLEDHVTDIKKFEKASQNVEDTDVKQYATQTLPTLQTHLQHTASAAKSVGVDESTINSYTKNTPAAAGGTIDSSESSRGAGQNQNAPKSY